MIRYSKCSHSGTRLAIDSHGRPVPANQRTIPFQGDLALKTSTLTKLFSTAAVVGALAAPALSQEEGITLPGASAEVTLDYVSQYFFRGYEQFESDQGIVLQPGASLTIPVVDGVTATVGTWMSIHSDVDAGGTNNPSSFYEADIYGSLDAEVGDFALSVSMTHFNYPAIAGSVDVLELGLGASYDDSEILGDFAINPYIYVGIEVNNTNTNNVDSNGNGDEAMYLELGGAFSLNSLTEGTFAEVWDWSVPFAFGLSLDDYYTDASGAEEFLGYISIGLAGSVPMSELIGTDEYFGAWDLSVGVTLLLLNSDVSAGAGNGFGQVDNADDTGDNFQFIASVGISREW